MNRFNNIFYSTPRINIKDTKEIPRIIVLFIKKSEILTTLPQKRKENLFSPMNLDPTTSKKFIFLIFFTRNFVYSIKDIYTN
jgi:hypothetical protein